MEVVLQDSLSARWLVNVRWEERIVQPSFCEDYREHTRPRSSGLRGTMSRGDGLSMVASSGGRPWLAETLTGPLQTPAIQ